VSERPSRSIPEAVPPATLLETDSRRLIRGDVVCMHDVETVREYVCYEDRHRRRRWVLRMLADRAATPREFAPRMAQLGAGLVLGTDEPLSDTGG